MADYWDQKPDLTRLPQHLKEGLSKPIPMREHESRAKVLIFPSNRAGLNHPNGRIQAIPFKPDSTNDSRVEGLQFELLDFTGLTPLVSAVMRIEDFSPMFAGLCKSYKQCGGDLSVLQKIIEEIDK